MIFEIPKNLVSYWALTMATMLVHFWKTIVQAFLGKLGKTGKTSPVTPSRDYETDDGIYGFLTGAGVRGMYPYDEPNHPPHFYEEITYSENGEELYHVYEKLDGQEAEVYRKPVIRYVQPYSITEISFTSRVNPSEEPALSLFERERKNLSPADNIFNAQETRGVWQGYMRRNITDGGFQRYFFIWKTLAFKENWLGLAEMIRSVVVLATEILLNHFLRI